ncbi:MAG: FHA domain-containing protein [Lachnospiraceae bacterium]|nr:FHA domain-containing protein [Lachnospiraceae bacterium]
MIELNIKNNGDRVVTEYLLKANDRVDNLTLGMLVNNKVEGVLPVMPVQIENERYFRYDISGMVTLKKYLGEYIKKERILKAFYGIAVAIRESKEYMINWTSFSLEQKDIYINEKTGEVGLICLPILSVINDGNICNFFKNILFTAQFDSEENGEYVGKLITILNPRTYTIEKFIYELEEMLEIEHRVFDEEEEESEEDAVIEEEVKDVEQDLEEEAEDKLAWEEKIQEKSVEDKVKEETEDIEEELKEETEVVEESVKKEAEPVLGETEEEEENVAKETAVPKSEVQEPVLEKRTNESPNKERPFLIRMSDNQKIEIDKDNFVIGKDDEKADYCIKDNPSIIEEHAFIIRNDREYFLVDNNSNYTYMNRVLIQPDEEVYIPHGAHLSFGDEEFEFRMHE